MSSQVANAQEAKVELGDIEVRLFYTETGRLSDNVLTDPDGFAFHNTIIGEGSAEEAADDILVSVSLTSGKFGSPEDNQVFLDSPVELLALDSEGNVFARRTHDAVLTSYKGTTHKVLWLADVTCKGQVTLIARFQNQTKSASLRMGCGE